MAATAGHMAVGMNLENVVDWSPAWIFTDAFKASRPWISHTFNPQTWGLTWDPAQAPALDLDANGNVKSLKTWMENGVQLRQIAGTLMFHALGGAYAGGTYRAEWDGSGTVTFGFDATVSASGVTASGRNFAELRVTPSDSGISLRIEATNPGDPVRDFNVWMPDWNGRTFAGQRWQPGAAFSPFHPLFLERLAPFKTLRFMGLQETNTTDIVTWSDRRDAADIRQGSGPGGTPSEPIVNGMSLEYMVRLANDLDADPWFNMPHMADDAFVRNFATYVRDHLEPGRTAYVEWANELWNFGWGFEASAWVKQRWTAVKLDSDFGQWIVTAREAKRDFDIWSSVFAGQTNRVVRVAAGQAANPWIVEQITAGMGGSFDAIALAPYISFTDAQRNGYTSATTVDRILADARANAATAIQWTRDHAALADRLATQLGRPIRLLAYEGGAHLDGRGGPYQNAFHAATNDPRMGGIYREYLRGLAAAGLDLYVDFQFTGPAGTSPWGDFAKLHRMDEPLATAWTYAAVKAAADGSLWGGPTPLPPPATGIGLNAIESAGSVALAFDNAGNIRANGTAVTFKGRPVRHVANSDAVWRYVAADVDGGRNTVVLQHSSGSLYHWRMDASWRQVSGDGWTPAGTPAFLAAEWKFGIDFDRNGVIGFPRTTIESAGSISLASDGARNLRVNDTPVTVKGSPVRYVTNPAAVWQYVAAEADGGRNTLVLQHSSGSLFFWRLDAFWGQVSGDGWTPAGTAAFFTAERRFGVDFDRNGRIGG